MGDHYIIECSYIKQPPLEGVPTKLVYAGLFQINGIQLKENRGKESQLPIMPL
jgi:hypothetical protein